MKLFILNGPPSSGKDSLANAVIGHDNTFAKTKFAFPIKEAVKAFFGLSQDQFDYFENNAAAKNQPHELFLGKSFRDACIDVAEVYAKPCYSDRVFGEILVNRLYANKVDRNSKNVNIIVSDGGFDSEVEPLVEAFGAENIVVLKLYRDKCDFSKDSRNYIDCEKLGIKNEYVLTNKKLDVFLREGFTLIQAIKMGTARPNRKFTEAKKAEKEQKTQ